MTRDDYTGPTTAPRTPAQRDAVARLAEHGLVWESGRGRYAVHGTNGAEVSDRMGKWLRENGYAEWQSVPGVMPYLVPVQCVGVEGIRSRVRSYQAGESRCGTCGRAWTEPTPAGRCPFEYVHPPTE